MNYKYALSYMESMILDLITVSAMFLICDKRFKNGSIVNCSLSFFPSYFPSLFVISEILRGRWCDRHLFYKRPRPKASSKLQIGAPLLINFHPGRRRTTKQPGRGGEGRGIKKRRVLSRIDAIEPRIIHAGAQNPGDIRAWHRWA